MKMKNKPGSFKIHSVKYNLLMNMILKVSSFLFPLITFPYISRVLLVEASGKVAFATSVVHYFALFASLGIPNYGIRACAKYRDDPDKLSKTVHELIAINLCCTIITYIAFGIMCSVIPLFRENALLLRIMSVTIILTTFGIEWFYQSIEQYDYITARNIAFKVISIALMFAFVHSPEDYIIYGGITVVGTVGSNILNIIRLPKLIKLKRYDSYNFRQHLKPTILLFFYTAATHIYTNLDVVMLGFLTGDTQVGLYNASIKVKAVIVNVITALGAVTLPRISNYLQNNRHDDFVNLIKKSFNYVLILSIPSTCFLILEAKNIIMFLSGSSFVDAVPAMVAISPSIVFIALSSVTAWQILIPSGRDKITIYGALIGSLVDVIINFALIPRYGALGAAIGTTIAEAAVLTTHIVSLKQTVYECIDMRNIGKVVFAGIIATISEFFLSRSISVNSVFIKLLIVGIFFVTIYGAMLLVLRENITKTYSNQFIKKVFRRQ